MDATGALSGGGPKTNLMFTVRSMASLLWVALLMRSLLLLFTAPVTARPVHWFSAPLNISDRSYQLGIQGGIKES